MLICLLLESPSTRLVCNNIALEGVAVSFQLGACVLGVCQQRSELVVLFLLVRLILLLLRR